MIFAGRIFAEIARAEHTSRRRVQVVVDLAMLAPDILDGISNGEQPVGLTSDYLIKSGVPAVWSDQVWVTDITYIKTNEGWLYFCVVIDLFSRRVVVMRDGLIRTDEPVEDRSSASEALGRLDAEQKAVHLA